MSKLTWISGGNHNFECCKTEDELSIKLNEVFEDLSRQVGDIRYSTDDGKQYAVGITISVLEIEKEEGETRVILN